MVKTLTQSSLTRNTTYLTLASLIQKIISFGYYSYLANALGPDNLGKYTFVLTFTSIFIIFMDFGLGPVLTREGSMDKEKLQNFFQNTLSVKTVLIVISLIAMVITINLFKFLGYQNVTAYDVSLVYLGGIIILLDTLTFTFFSVFRALKQMKFEALSIIIYQSLVVGSGILALKLNLPLEYILGALIIGSSFNLIYASTILIKKTDLKFRFKISGGFFWKLLKLSAPFAIAGIFYRLNGSIDSVMLKLLAGDRYVGWYALAFKLTFALTVIPGSFATSYFPEVSYWFKHEKSKITKLFENGFFYMLILSLPLAIGTLLLADKIILTVWGPDFEASIKALQILIVSLFFLFINYPIGNLLNACNRQTLNTLNMGVALMVNVVLNFFLIPRYTYLGASLTALISSVVLVFLGLPWVYKITKFKISFLLKKLILVLISALGMGVIIFLLQDSIHLVLLIALGGFSYLALILLTTAVSPSDLKALLKRGKNA